MSDLVRREVVEGVVECSATASRCRCNLVAGHDGAHECEDQTVCGGIWKGDIDGGDFEIIRFPLEVSGG